MENSTEPVTFLCGNETLLSQASKLRALQPFAPEIVGFLNALSNQIRSDKRSHKYPDLLTFAFWCRKSSISAMQKNYLDLQLRLGLGVVFHIAPSNVATTFAYTLAAGLLAGNINIVRLPSNLFEQITIITECINVLLANDFQNFKGYIYLIRYPYDSKITDFLSSNAEARVIWGGNNTISEIRKSPISPQGIDIGFADRYSVCIIDSDAYLADMHKNRIARDFYADSYSNDQKGCSSPSIIIWLGKNSSYAQEVFWQLLEQIVKEKYILTPIQSVQKLESLCLMATAHNVRQQSTSSNHVIRVQLHKIDPDLLKYCCGSGFFMEYVADNLEEILPLCNKGCQTVSYYGVSGEALISVLRHNRVAGVDRIVKIGKCLEFSLIWDGHDLIHLLSRKLYH